MCFKQNGQREVLMLFLLSSQRPAFMSGHQNETSKVNTEMGQLCLLRTKLKRLQKVEKRKVSGIIICIYTVPISYCCCTWPPPACYCPFSVWWTLLLSNKSFSSRSHVLVSPCVAFCLTECVHDGVHIQSVHIQRKFVLQLTVREDWKTAGDAQQACT